MAKRAPLVSLVLLSFFTLSSWDASFAQINWDGGDGDWTIDALWSGGQTAQEVFGGTNGFEVSKAIDSVVNISSGNVTYDPNTFGDFRVRSTADTAGAVVNLSGGATLAMDSSVAVDGNWSQFDGETLNIDNATIRRTQSGASNSGGAFILGSWRSYENQVINVNLTNGGTIDNHGQLWFGAWDDNAVGLDVNMTINDGHLDLKGGLEQNLGPNFADADLVFISGWEGFDANAGGGMAKNEQYSINFTGPGSISVTEAGIIHAVQDEFGLYNDTDITLLTYENLWNQGILQAHGFSGAQGAKFGGFFSVDGQLEDPTYVLNSNVTDPIDIVWDGGDGEWNDVGGKWNGGQISTEVFGRSNGLEIGSGEVGFDVYINDGNVSYDPNAFGDFRFRAGGSLNLGEGASLSLDTTDAVDGFWTEFDGQAINIDGGTLRRTRSGDALSGGALILGSWRSYDEQAIEVNLSNGGTLENHGQLWFGAWADNAPGLEVTVTIDDGHLDLTGGDSFDLLTGNEGEVGPGNADLVFINGFDGEAKGEQYAINFVGPGSITVDKAGIINAVADGNDSDPANYGDTLDTLLSYEDLWSVGLLQANGQSGLDGAVFAEFFTVTGAVGEDDYTLMSLLGGAPAVLQGDLDGDGSVAFADFLVLSANFGMQVNGVAEGDIDGDGMVAFADFLVLSANFGQMQAAVATVPEPCGWIAGWIAVGFAFTGRRRRSR